MDATSLSMKEARMIAAQCVDTKDFEIVHVKESNLGQESGGFMSDYLRFEIRIRLPDRTEKSQHFFSKTLPRNPGQHREFVLQAQCYVKETGFYRDIVPLLMKHLKETSRSNEKNVKGIWAPYCFFTRDDIIIMEDLSIVGFKIPSNRELLDWNHCVAVLKKIASFHAASIIFEEKEKLLTGKTCNIGAMHPKNFTGVLEKSMSDDETIGWFPAGVRALVALVPHLTKYQHSKNIQRKIQEEFPSFFLNITMLGPSDKYRNVVCHGDLWSNNILFRYRSDKRPETARFVDYQILRYAPPVTDIVVFLFTTTNRTFRERHNEALLGVYYDEFSSELQSSGLSADELLNLEELKRSFEFFSPAGRAVAGLYYQLITMENEQRNEYFSSPDKYSKFFLYDRSSDVRDTFLKDEVYRYRLEEVLNELIDKDILKEESSENGM